MSGGCGAFHLGISISLHLCSERTLFAFSVVPYEGGCLTPLSIERLPVLQPLLAHLLFCLALIIDGRNQGHGTLDLHQHNVLDGTGGPTLAVEGHRLLKERSSLIHRRRAFEAIALASNGIDHVDLDDRLQLHIGDGSRRADIGENEVVIVPDGRGPFRRKIRRAVWADRGHKAKPLFGDDAFHILRQADGCFPVHPSPFLPSKQTHVAPLDASLIPFLHAHQRAYSEQSFLQRAIWSQNEGTTCAGGGLSSSWHPLCVILSTDEGSAQQEHDRGRNPASDSFLERGSLLLHLLQEL